MQQVTQKIIGFLMLFILAFSCTGLGLGMFGYKATSSHHIGSEHDCCTPVDNSMDTAHSNIFLNHHDFTPYTLSEKIFINTLIFVFVSFVYFSVSHFLYFKIFRYIHLWQDRWKYFAFLFTRLFSQGILHSKAW